MSMLTLSPNLDTPAADPLRKQLLRRIELGEPLNLDASPVERIGLASLQVLASARIAAGEAKLGFAILQPSETFSSMATLAQVEPLLEPMR